MKKTILAWVVSLALALFSVPALAAPQFMNFPVTGFGPFMPNIMSSVLDHEVNYAFTVNSSVPNGVNGPYGASGGILSYTGELFIATAGYPAAQNACYPKPANANQTATWSMHLQGVYTGTSGCLKNVALNYDNHPGYDYIISSVNYVRPAASGSIIFNKCIKTFTDIHTCESYGAVAVDHGNGFVTQYLHMSNLNYGVAASGSNQPVTTSWLLGKVGGVAPGGVSVHLHLEVLQRKAVPLNTGNYYARENYMVVDPYGYNTASPYADLLQSKPGCLWVVGCSY